MKTARKVSIRRTFRVIESIVALLLIFLVVQGVILWRVCQGGSRATRGLMTEGLPSLHHLAVLQENLVLYRLRSYELMFVPEQERPAKASQADQLDQENRLALFQAA